jgi:pimeloyl-ACP methyl ester carboxylesterase
VLLLHAFQSGRAWRLQLPGAAAARAAAPDLRGYGGSVKPVAVEEYRMLAHVADNVAIVNELGAEGAAVVGHDWGSPIAAASALMRPDLFTAVGLLGVPYTPRGDVRPSEAFAQMGGEEEFYVSYFNNQAAPRPGSTGAACIHVASPLLMAIRQRPPAGSPCLAGRLRDRFPRTTPVSASRGRARRARPIWPRGLSRS